MPTTPVDSIVRKRLSAALPSRLRCTRRSCDVGAGAERPPDRCRPSPTSPAAAGIRFRHDSGAFGKKYLPETMGAGGAFFDADGDGAQDILLVNSMPWPGQPARQSLPGALQEQPRRHVHRRHRGVGPRRCRSTAWASPPADYDNDGKTDVYITALGRNRLFRNLGGDALRRRDGGGRGRHRRLLDERRVVRLRPRRPARSVRHPLRGRGRWRRTSTARSTARPSRTARRRPTRDRARCSIATAATARSRTRRRRPACCDPAAKALGIALLDYNGDGWLDLFVANDTQPNRLYREQAERARSPTIGRGGRRRLQRSGRRRAPAWASTPPTTTAPADQSLVIGNFSNEMIALYHNEGGGLFIDEAPASADRQDLAARP